MCANLFSLFDIACNAHGPPVKTEEAPCCLFSPCSPCYSDWPSLPPILDSEEHLWLRGSQRTRQCVWTSTRSPRHPSSPSCHSPLCQLHFLSCSLGINSCIPASCQSQEEGGLFSGRTGLLLYLQRRININ